MQNGKEIIMFSDTEIKKQKFHSHKIPISIDDVNIDRTAVSNKVPSSKKGFKYFIRYEDDYEKVMPCVYLQQWVQTEETLMKLNISFLINDNKLLQTYNEIWIWDKVKNFI